MEVRSGRGLCHIPFHLVPGLLSSVPTHSAQSWHFLERYSPFLLLFMEYEELEMLIQEWRCPRTGPPQCV